MNDTDAPAGATEEQVRPVGTWVVAGFLLTVTLAMWVVVAIIFHARG